MFTHAKTVNPTPDPIQRSSPCFHSSLRSALTLNQCFCCPWKAAIQWPLPTEREIRPALTPDTPADRRQTDAEGIHEDRQERACRRAQPPLSQHSSHTPAIADRVTLHKPPSLPHSSLPKVDPSGNTHIFSRRPL